VSNVLGSEDLAVRVQPKQFDQVKEDLEAQSNTDDEVEDAEDA
jgi:hypothetical protein